MGVEMAAGGTAVAEPLAAPAPSRSRRRPSIWIQAAALFGIYVALTFVCDPRGFLGTDTGAKVATLEMMDRHSTVVPDVGYWAKEQDPDAAVHPLIYTKVLDDKFVNVTTVPMIVAAYPLYELGGYRLALLLPILGAVACAFAARSLARRIGSTDPDLAFWVVGLASPVAIYALDLWEHAPGLALMLFGVVKMYDAGRAEGRVRDSLAAGLLFGAAATMRTESFVFGLVAGAVLLGSLLVSTRNLKAVLLRGAAAVAGVGAALAANLVLERAVLGGSLRAGRAATAAGSSGSEFGTRAKEAIVTTFGVNLGSDLFDWIAIACVLAFVVLAVRAVQRNWPARATRDLLFLLALPVLLRAFSKPSFAPGFLIAFPLAALGLAYAWRDGRRRLLAIVALAALPLVWMSQYVGGAYPQWGGRYVLATSILLGVIGLVAAMDLVPVLAKGAIVLSLVITLAGVVNLSFRSHDADRVGKLVTELPQDVVIARNGFLMREFGAAYDETRPWLTAYNDDLLTKAFGVAEACDADTVALLTMGAPEFASPKIDGWKVTTRQKWDVFYQRLDVVTYERAG
jgi:hypothetical protein